MVGNREDTIPIMIGEGQDTPTLLNFFTTRTSRCIIKLGTSGTIIGFDIDTTHFNGNEGPEAAVEALFNASPEVPRVNDARVSEYNY